MFHVSKFLHCRDIKSMNIALNYSFSCTQREGWSLLDSLRVGHGACVARFYKDWCGQDGITTLLNKTYSDWFLLLTDAVLTGDVKLVEFLFLNGCKRYENALHIALTKNDVPMIQFLLNNNMKSTYAPYINLEINIR